MENAVNLLSIIIVAIIVLTSVWLFFHFILGMRNEQSEPITDTEAPDNWVAKVQAESKAWEEKWESSETKVISSHPDSDYELCERAGRMFVKRKPYKGYMTGFTRCKYCGSKNADSNSNCTQCGGEL